VTGRVRGSGGLQSRSGALGDVSLPVALHGSFGVESRFCRAARVSRSPISAWRDRATRRKPQLPPLLVVSLSRLALCSSVLRRSPVCCLPGRCCEIVPFLQR